jgi:4-amino-4-deoxy-L-arabinose transferase-like glycosyltransferase
VRFLNLLLGLGTLVLVYFSSRNYFEEKIAITTMILVGFCTAPIFYEWFPEKTALVLFLTSLSFYLFSRAAKSGNLALWLAACVSIGVASLAHMMIFVMVPAGIAHLLVNGKGSWSGALRSTLMLSAGFLLGVLPATIHNYLQDGDLVLVSSNGGQNFYTGNFSGNDTGHYTVAPFSEADLVSEELRFKQEAERRTQRTMKPSEVSRFWFRQGWADMRELPGLSVKRIWRRLRWTLGATEVSDTRTYEFYQSRYRLLQVPFLGFGFISWLGMLGLLLTIGVRTNLVLSAFIFLFTVELSLFFVYGRYRLPLIIPLGMFAAVALHRLADIFRQRRAGRRISFRITTTRESRISNLACPTVQMKSSRRP